MKKQQKDKKVKKDRREKLRYIREAGLTHYSFYHKYFLCCIPNN